MRSLVRILPAVFALVAAAPVPPPLAVRVTPVYGRAPKDVQIVVRVARRADNRLLRVALDSDGYYRSSDIALAGAGASAQHVLLWRAVPSGRYTVMVTLYDSSGVNHVARTQMELVGEVTDESPRGTS